MQRDHEPLTIEDFRGLIDNGEDETTPQGGFIASQNNMFARHEVYSRDGLDTHYAIPSVRRIHIYRIEGQAQRLLILDGSGNLYDSTSLGAPILTIPAMIDFSSETIFGRAYITPHNGVKGLPGEKVYVYNGVGSARPAAGAKPTGFNLTLAESAQVGHIEPGVHAFALAFETQSGHVTGYAGFQQVTSSGGHKVDVSTIRMGPPGTVARILVATKTLINFNGDFDNQTYYEVPGGRIGDNTTTATTVDFYDADLENEFSSYAERLEVIPAGVGIGLYNGRMIVWGTDQDSSVCYASDSGSPEAINGVEGFVTINPGDAGSGLKNCWEHRGQLVCQKSQRTYSTLDNGENAAFWSVTLLDNSVGTECHGVGKVLDFGHIVEDLILVCHTNGLRLYNGVFDDTPLSYGVADIWDRINKLYFNKVEIAIDPINNRIFVALPLDNATYPNYILYGDYTEGLGPTTVKWDLWKFPNDPVTVVVDVDFPTRESSPNFGMYTGGIYKLKEDQHNDYGNAIDAWHEHAMLPSDGDGISHFTGVNIRAKGVGTLQISVRGLDSVDTLDVKDIDLVLANRRPTFAGFNFTSYRAAVKFRVNSFNAYYSFTKFQLLIAPMWENG